MYVTYDDMKVAEFLVICTYYNWVADVLKLCAKLSENSVKVLVHPKPSVKNTSCRYFEDRPA